MSDPRLKQYARLESECLELMAASVLADTAFNDCALQLYRYQRAGNQPYRNFCVHLGAPETLRDWRQIPAVPQSAFKRFALRSFSESAITKSFHTSGTTGEGFGRHDFVSLRLYDEAVVRGWDHFGLPTLPQVILVLPPEAAPHSSLSHMMGALRARAKGGRQEYCVRSDGVLDEQKLRSVIERAASADEPVMVLGTALAFLHWFDLLEARGESFTLPAGSQAFETGGYKGTHRTIPKQELYERFTYALGLGPEEVVNEYGMTELSSQFYARGVSGLHGGAPWIRALVVDPETGEETAVGETGLLRLYDLANIGSVLAIETQDLAVKHEAGFELIGRDPAALPRGCSRPADEILSQALHDL